MDRGNRIRSESALREAVLAGNERAWRTLYEECYEPVLRYARWRTGARRELTEDLAAETWLVAVRRIADFDPGRGRFLDWLRGITANLLRNHRRAGLIRPPTVSLTTDPSGSANVDFFDQTDIVAAALARLPERYEAVLRAKYLDGDSVASIAAAWNTSEKTVESLLARARAAFRAIAEEWVETYDRT